LTGHDEQVREAEQRRERAADVYVERASALGRRRSAAARKLEPAVRKQLAPLALGQAQFAVELSATAGEAVSVGGDGSMPLHPRGAERAEFRLAANPGEPPRPLHKVASGGELSRVMLALHVAVDGAGEDRVLIFDEIDAGVGGRAADAVGRRLAALARHSQVLCVTHLPQVAVYADRHFSVRKWVEGERTHTAVDCLDPEARVEELARMLGGKQATATSRRHAEELLAGATTRRPARGARRRA
jgi:DNA repair protein RecN (Recombination protein N)